MAKGTLASIYDKARKKGEFQPQSTSGTRLRDAYEAAKKSGKKIDVSTFQSQEDREKEAYEEALRRMRTGEYTFGGNAKEPSTPESRTDTVAEQYTTATAPGSEYPRLLQRRATLVSERGKLANSLPISEYRGNSADAVSGQYDRKKEIDAELSQIDSEIQRIQRNAKVAQTERDVKNSADFAEYSQKGAEIEPSKNKSFWEPGALIDWMTSSQTGNKVTAAEEGLAASKEDPLLSAANYLMNYGQVYGQSNLTYMTDDEISVYNYLLAKDKDNGTNDADAYLDDLEPTLMERGANSYLQRSSDFAEEHPVQASATSVLRSPLGVAAYTDELQQKAMGKDVDINRMPAAMVRANTGVRSTISDNIASDVSSATGSEFVGDTVSFLYQTGLSIADSLVNTAASGGNAFMSSALMGGSAASSAMIEAKERGATDEQALQIGGAAGIFEALFEKVSIDSFLKEASPAARGALVKNILRQMGVEASEEVATEIANIATDALIMRDQSQYADMSAGEIASQIALAGLGGALSGGVMGGTATVVSGARASSIGNNLQKQGVQDQVIQDALGSTDSATRDLAGSMQEGKTKTNARNLGRLYAGMQQAEDAMPSTGDALRDAAMQMATEQEQAAQPKQEDTHGSPQSASAAEAEDDDYTLPARTTPAAAQTRRDAAVNDRTGENVQIVGVDSVDDGTVYVKDADGDILPIADVKFANPQTTALYEAASEFDTATAQKFIAGYDGGNVQQYTQGFSRVYSAAQAGIGYDQVLENSAVATEYLSEDQRLTAYGAGQTAAKTPNLPKKYTPGLTRAYTRDALSSEGRQAIKKYRKQLEAIDVIAKKYGREVVLVSSLKGMTIGGTTIEDDVNGAYDPESKRIYIAADAQDGAFAYVAMHEMVHSIKDESTDGYNALRDAVFEALEAAGEDVDALTKYQMDKFGYDNETAIEEVIANTAPTILTDENFVSDLYNNNRNLFDKIKAFIDELRQVFAELTKSGSWQQDTLLNEESVRKIADVFDKVARDEGADSESDVKLSANDVDNYTEAQYNKRGWARVNGVIDAKELRTFMSQLSDQKNGARFPKTDDGKRMYAVGEKFGVNNVIIVSDGRYINPSIDRVYRIELFNETDIEIVRDWIYEHEQLRGWTPEVSDVTKLYGEEIVSLNRKSDFPEYNEIANRGSLRSGRKSKGNQRDYRNKQDGGRNSSEGRGSEVKFSVNDSAGRTLSKEQQEFFADSKVRDENGNLMVMYRGDGDQDFTVFDRKKSRPSNLYGRGFYFTDSKSHAGQYGDVREFYLNIKRPLSPGQHSITKQQMRRFINAVAQNDEEYDLYNYGTDNPSEVLKMVFDGRDDFAMLQDVNATAIGDLVEAVELFNRVNGTEYDGIILETETITFASNQAKNVDNANPTDSPDIRFSMRDSASKFSAKDPVERKGTLLAIHNLTGDQLRKFLALGGAPMPSIAVTRSDVEHSNFGDISLIFDKSTIDPKANKKNVVYSADAWTPTFPQIEYEADSKVENAAYHTLHDLMGNMESYFADDLKRVIYSVGDMLNREGGEQGFIEYAMNNMGMKAAYLESKGVHIDRVTKQQERPKGFSDERVDKYQAITEILGTTDIIELMSMPLNEMKDKYGEQLEAVFPGMTKSAMRMSNVIKQTGRWLAYDGSGALYDEVTDYDAMRRAVEEKVDESGFREWVNGLYRGIEASSGVYNGKDIYTPSGNRRSFAATHYPATLENIAKAMAAQNNGNTKNVSGFNGIKTLRAGMTTRFKGIADMHNLEGRLQNRTQEEADALNDALSNRMYDLMKRIDLYRNGNSSSNSYERMDFIGNLMMEVADSGQYSVESIKDVFTRSGMAISDDVANDVRKLLFDVQQMPVNLFEAKPERAVYTDEVRMAVMPAGEYPEIEQRFNELGIPVEHYSPDVAGDRVKVMNSAVTEPLRFSMRDTTPANTDRLEKENTKLKAALANARAQVKLTGGHEVSRPAVEKLARKIVRENQSKADAGKIANDLMQIYSYAAASTDSEAALKEIDGLGIGVAKKVLEQSEMMDTSVSDQLADLKDYLRNTGIRLNEDQKAEAAAMYGSYNDFRRQYFGTIKLTNDGVPLDVAWGELSEQYPWLFDPEGNDMLESLTHAVEQTKPRLVNPYGYDLDGAAADLWLQIQDEYVNLPEVRTFADKQKAKLDKLRTDQKQLIADMRKEAQKRTGQRISDARTAERMAEGRKQSAERQKADAKLETQKQRSDARIEALEARIRELEQQVQDERAAGQVNTAIERKAGRQAVEDARTAERMAEGRIRSEERQKAAERLAEQKQHDADKLREVREQRDQKRVTDLREQRETMNMQRKERDEATKYRERIMANAKTLTAWLTKPTDDKHVPEGMRRSIARFLETLEWGDGTKNTKKGNLWRSRLFEMYTQMEKVNNSPEEGEFLDIDPDLTARMNEFLEGTPDTITSIGNLNVQQLRDLDYILQVTKRTVTYANRLRANTRYQQITALGEASMKEMDSSKAKGRFWQTFSGADKFFNIQQLDSFSFFEGLGEASKTVLQELRSGFDTKIRRVQQAVEYIKPFTKGIKMRELSGKTAKLHEFKLNDGTLQMTTAQIMELYELLKREQARGHVFGSGIRVADISRGKLKPEVTQIDPVQITVEEANRITDVLTKEQKDLADRMAWFLGNVCAAWGNQTSVQMYGYKKFNEENYYPIKTDANYTQTNDKNDKNQNGSLAALKNLGMTKAVQKGANNPLIVGDIFDTFTQHVDDMASYNGLMIPLSDAMKWFNYKEKTDDLKVRSVKRSMERRAGKYAQGYFTTLIKNLNGINDRGERIGIMDELTSNAKAAAIGANMRVVLQQPTAFVRAAAVIDPKYLTAGLKQALNKNKVAEAQKYSAIALWKSWGFYDISVGKDMRSLLFNDGNFAERMKEWSMSPAGWADEQTWGTLYMACLAEAKDKHSDVSAEEQKVIAGQRLSEIVDKTQVVDSPFHKSQLMRSKDGLTRMYTAFMAEPTKSYNLLHSAIANVSDKHDKDAYKRLARTAVAWLLSAVATSAFAAIADVGRDEDETKKTIDKYSEALVNNLADNANPLNMIPVVKDVISLLQGYDASRMDLQAADKLINVGKIWLRQLSAEKGEKPYTFSYMAYQTAQAISSMTGIPVGNLMREVNSVAGLFGANLKTKTDMVTATERYERLYDSILESDAEMEERIRDVLREDDKSYKDIDTGIAKVLMAQDERIAEAYELREMGDVKGLNRLREELMKTFDEEIVDRAINLYANAVEGEDGEKDLDEELDAPLYDYDDMQTVALAAFDSGDVDDLKIVVEEIKKDSDAKDPAEAVRSKASSLFKPVYLEALDNGYSQKAKHIKGILTGVYGMDAETIDNWQKNRASEEFYTLLEDGDLLTANKKIREMKNLGRDDDSIIASVRSKYKDQVVNAYKSGDMATYRKLVNMLKNLNLYDSKGKLYFTDEKIQNWLKD